jgi:peptidoglycan pentaglycine glycine transferase (the first glycine)
MAGISIGKMTETLRPQWNRLVSRTSLSGFMQSWEWSEFKEKQGMRVERIGIFDNDEIIGGAIVFCKVSSRTSSPLVIPHGPVLPWEDTESASRLFQSLMREITVIAESLSSPLIRFEPLWQNAVPPFFKECVRAPMDLVPTPTRIIDLNQSRDQLWSSLKHKGRTNIRLGYERGVSVSVKRSTDSLDDFYALFELTSLRHGFSAENREFFELLTSELASMTAVYEARYNGICLACALVLFFGGKATYLYGGSSPFFRDKKPGYVLQWEIMQDARKRGCGRYDLYGIAPREAPRHPYAKFSQFKESFGGEIQTTLGAYDYYVYSEIAKLVVDNVSNRGWMPDDRSTASIKEEAA